jgi:hypothetical protein
MGVVVLYVLGVNNRSFMAFSRCVISRSHLHLSISASTIPPSSASLLAFENSCIKTYKELYVFMNEHNNRILLVHVPDVFAYVCIRCRHVLGNGDSPFIYQGGVYTQQFGHCTDNNIFTVVVRYTIYNIQYTIYNIHYSLHTTVYLLHFFIQLIRGCGARLTFHFQLFCFFFKGYSGFIQLFLRFLTGCVQCTNILPLCKNILGGHGHNTIHTGMYRYDKYSYSVGSVVTPTHDGRCNNQKKRTEKNTCRGNT